MTRKIPRWELKKLFRKRKQRYKTFRVVYVETKVGKAVLPLDAIEYGLKHYRPYRETLEKS